MIYLITHNNGFLLREISGRVVPWYEETIVLKDPQRTEGVSSNLLQAQANVENHSSDPFTTDALAYPIIHYT